MNRGGFFGVGRLRAQVGRDWDGVNGTTMVQLGQAQPYPLYIFFMDSGWKIFSGGVNSSYAAL